MAQLFIPMSFSMWGISKEDLKGMLDTSNLTSEEKESILDEYEKTEDL